MILLKNGQNVRLQPTNLNLVDFITVGKPLVRATVSLKTKYHSFENTYIVENFEAKTMTKLLTIPAIVYNFNNPSLSHFITKSYDFQKVWSMDYYFFTKII